MENNENMQPQDAVDPVSTTKDIPRREMMEMPDGTVADVTGKTAEEKREMLNEYNKN